jgi:hypothetical protein
MVGRLTRVAALGIYLDPAASDARDQNRASQPPCAAGWSGAHRMQVQRPAGRAAKPMVRPARNPCPGSFSLRMSVRANLGRSLATRQPCVQNDGGGGVKRFSHQQSRAVRANQQAALGGASRRLARWLPWCQSGAHSMPQFRRCSRNPTRAPTPKATPSE